MCQGGKWSHCAGLLMRLISVQLEADQEMPRSKGERGEVKRSNVWGCDF